MKLKIDPVEDHRSREKNSLVYPVYSRRSRGLSVGINLFPERKVCSFDCPYCEVFPFRPGAAFDIAVMEEALVSALEKARKDGVPVKDVCFSGNGEPSLSPCFRAALEKARDIRDSFVPDAALVLITNGTGLMDAPLFDFLVKEADRGLSVWLKVDAATEEWFRKINRPSGGPVFNLLLGRIRDFAEKAPFVVQTMICRIEGSPAPCAEERAWVKLVTELASGGRLRGVQIYGKARPSPDDPAAEALDLSFLNSRAASLRAAMEAASSFAPVEVFP